jgi:hypothetical protein
MNEGTDSNIFTFQEAMRIEQEAHRLDQQRKEEQVRKQEEKRLRMGLPLQGERALSKAEQEARIYAFMYVTLSSLCIARSDCLCCYPLSGPISLLSQIWRTMTTKILMTTLRIGSTMIKTMAGKARISLNQIMMIFRQ